VSYSPLPSFWLGFPKLWLGFPKRTLTIYFPYLAA
jgi:hypothetical protein